MKREKATCVTCARPNMTIAAKGMCWSCYDRIKHGKPIIKPAPDELDEPIAVSYIPTPVDDPDFPGTELKLPLELTRHINPLFYVAHECEINLNFTGNHELFAWLRDNQVTADHIIELLEISRQGQLRMAA